MEWQRGPPGTDYEGGVFTAVMKFPLDYPLNPPKMIFTCDMFHPNSKYNNNRFYMSKYIPMVKCAFLFFILQVKIPIIMKVSNHVCTADCARRHRTMVTSAVRRENTHFSRKHARR